MPPTCAELTLRFALFDLQDSSEPALRQRARRLDVLRRTTLNDTTLGAVGDVHLHFTANRMEHAFVNGTVANNDAPAAFGESWFIMRISGAKHVACSGVQRRAGSVQKFDDAQTSVRDWQRLPGASRTSRCR